MKTLLVFAFLLLALATPLSAGPIILTSDDLADLQEGPIEHLQGGTSWLGLYAQGSRINVAQVKTHSRKNQAQTPAGIVIIPPDPELLLSGVPGISPGLVVTVDRNLDLSPSNCELHLKLGSQAYIIRLQSKTDDLCDAEIILSTGSLSQRLYPPASGQAFACDEPHFRIHWAGDMDRDGRLDILATFSPKYSYHPRQLFLSAKSPKGALVLDAVTYVRLAQ